MTTGCADYIDANRDAVLTAFDDVDLASKVYWHTSESMREIDDEAVQLVVTSPPDPMDDQWATLFRNRHAGVWAALERGVDDEAFDLMHDLLDTVWGECYRVLADGGILAAIVSDVDRDENTRWRNTVEVKQRCQDHGFTPLTPIQLTTPDDREADRDSAYLPTSADMTTTKHQVLLFRKGSPREMDPDAPLVQASQFTEDQYDRWFSPRWSLDKGLYTGVVGQLPAVIPHRLIRMYSALGDTVVDPFLGSGTVAGVARELGRSGIGYEIQQTKLYGQVEHRLQNAALSKSQILDWHIQQERASNFTL